MIPNKQDSMIDSFITVFDDTSPIEEKRPSSNANRNGMMLEHAFKLEAVAFFDHNKISNPPAGCRMTVNMLAGLDSLWIVFIHIRIVILCFYPIVPHISIRPLQETPLAPRSHIIFSAVHNFLWGKRHKKRIHVNRVNRTQSIHRCKCITSPTFSLPPDAPTHAGPVHIEFFLLRLLLEARMTAKSLKHTEIWRFV